MTNTQSRPADYSFIHYLDAKKSVDDQALNAHVWRAMLQALSSRSLQKSPLTLLELGGGTGVMFQRLIHSPSIPNLDYHLLDTQPEVVDEAERRLHAISSTTGAPAVPAPFATRPRHSHVIAAPTPRHTLSLYAADLFDFLEQEPHLDHVDCVVAHAVLDLIDLDRILPLISQRFRPGAWLYFTINFDGATILQPVIDPVFDAQIEAAYHATMDARRIDGHPSGHSQTGRRLFHAMHSAGLQVLEAGSSDWVVLPRADHTYAHAEAYFLHCIIHTMEQALQDNPQLDNQQFRGWIETRHQQIEQGQLVYIAHQLDFLGRVPEAS